MTLVCASRLGKVEVTPNLDGRLKEVVERLEGEAKEEPKEAKDEGNPAPPKPAPATSSATPSLLKSPEATFTGPSYPGKGTAVPVGCPVEGL